MVLQNHLMHLMQRSNRSDRAGPCDQEEDTNTSVTVFDRESGLSSAEERSQSAKRCAGCHACASDGQGLGRPRPLSQTGTVHQMEGRFALRLTDVFVHVSSDQILCDLLGLVGVRIREFDLKTSGRTAVVDCAQRTDRNFLIHYLNHVFYRHSSPLTGKKIVRQNDVRKHGSASYREGKLLKVVREAPAVRR